MGTKKKTTEATRNQALSNLYQQLANLYKDDEDSPQYQTHCAEAEHFAQLAQNSAIESNKKQHVQATQSALCALALIKKGLTEKQGHHVNAAELQAARQSLQPKPPSLKESLRHQKETLQKDLDVQWEGKQWQEALDTVSKILSNAESTEPEKLALEKKQELIKQQLRHIGRIQERASLWETWEQEKAYVGFEELNAQDKFKKIASWAHTARSLCLCYDPAVADEKPLYDEFHQRFVSLKQQQLPYAPDEKTKKIIVQEMYQ